MDTCKYCSCYIDVRNIGGENGQDTICTDCVHLWQDEKNGLLTPEKLSAHMSVLNALRNPGRIEAYVIDDHPAEQRRVIRSENMEQQTNLESIENMKPVNQREPLVLDSYHMKPVKIASIERVESESGYLDGKFVEKLPVPQQQILVTSEPLTTLQNREGKAIPICSKEWFNVVQMADGSLGWSTSEKGKLQRFMKAVKVAHPKDLIGKMAIVKVVDRENNDGTRTQILRYMY